MGLFGNNPSPDPNAAAGLPPDPNTAAGLPPDAPAAGPQLTDPVVVVSKDGSKLTIERARLKAHIRMGWKEQVADDLDDE